MKKTNFIKFLEAIIDFKIPTTEGLMILNIVSFLFLHNIRINFSELFSELLPFATLVLYYAVLGLVLVIRDAYDFYKKDILSKAELKKTSLKADSDTKSYLENLDNRVSELEKAIPVKLAKYAIFSLAAIVIMVDLIMQIIIG